MIQTQGFASSQSIGSLTDEINRWMVSNTQGMDNKFRLIDIKYASSTESTTTHSHVNYSALVIYEAREIKKTDDGYLLVSIAESRTSGPNESIVGSYVSLEEAISAAERECEDWEAYLNFDEKPNLNDLRLL